VGKWFLRRGHRAPFPPARGLGSTKIGSESSGWQQRGTKGRGGDAVLEEGAPSPLPTSYGSGSTKIGSEGSGWQQRGTKGRGGDTVLGRRHRAPSSARGLGSAVSSPSGVRVKDLSEIDLGKFSTL